MKIVKTIKDTEFICVEDADRIVNSLILDPVNYDILEYVRMKIIEFGIDPSTKPVLLLTKVTPLNIQPAISILFEIMDIDKVLSVLVPGVIIENDTIKITSSFYDAYHHYCDLYNNRERDIDKELDSYEDNMDFSMAVYNIISEFNKTKKGV